jgi:hypothetical protein
MAVAEVARLEEVYFSSTGTYSSDLDAIGFKPNPPLQYYRVSVPAVNGPDGSMFQVTANPLSGGDPGQARSVTRYTSNQGDEKNSGGGGGSGGQGKTSTVKSIGKLAVENQSVEEKKMNSVSNWVEPSPRPAKMGKLSIMEKGTASVL